MNSSDSSGKVQLQLACKLSGASWAAWLSLPDRSNALQQPHTQNWQPGLSFGLSPKRLRALEDFLLSASQSKWLSGALASGRMRWQDCNPSSSPGCKRMYIFPNPAAHLILAAGFESIDANGENLFRLLSSSPPAPLAVTPAAPPRAAITGISLEIIDLILNGEALETTLQHITNIAHQITGARNITIRVHPKPGKRSVQAALAGVFSSNGGPASQAPNGHAIKPQQAVDAGDSRVNQTDILLPFAANSREQIITIPPQASSETKRFGELILIHSVEHEAPLPEQEYQDLCCLAGLAALAIQFASLNRELTLAFENQMSVESRLLRSIHLAALGEISTEIANNLNNPLTSLILSLELINKQISPFDGALPDQVVASLKHNLTLALGQAMRTRSIAWELLNTARQTRPLNKPDPSIFHKQPDQN